MSTKSSAAKGVAQAAVAVAVATAATAAKAPFAQVAVNAEAVKGMTSEKVEAMVKAEKGKHKAELVTAYGNKSNAIRGLAALGLKAGPISKLLDIRYQHARNVLQRPLKRNVKEQRDAAKAKEVVAQAAPAIGGQQAKAA